MWKKIYSITMCEMLLCLYIEWCAMLWGYLFARISRSRSPLYLLFGCACSLESCLLRSPIESTSDVNIELKAYSVEILDYPTLLENKATLESIYCEEFNNSIERRKILLHHGLCNLTGYKQNLIWVFSKAKRSFDDSSGFCLNVFVSIWIIARWRGRIRWH